MTHDRTFSDDELSCFLDGETSKDDSQQINQAISTDTSVSKRLQAMQDATFGLEKNLATLLDMAPPMPELPPAQKAVEPTVWITGGISMLAGAAAAAAVILLPQFQKTTTPGWKDVVANYQSLYVTETLASVSQPAEVSAKALMDLSLELGFNLTELPEVPGLTYKRSQQLGFNGKPLAQLTFLTADGGPVALCIVRTDKTDSDSITAETLWGMSAYSWNTQGYGVLLIGPKGDENLNNAAEMFRAALS